MSKIITYIRFFLSGMAFGMANVIPGVSGGTMLVVFGIYDKLTEAISGIKAIFKNFLFLFCFGLGAGSGILLFAFVITSLFESFGLQTNMFFIGLILGSVPLIVKSGTEDSKVKPLCLLPFVLALGGVIALAVLERSGFISASADSVDSFSIFLCIKMFVCAVIASVTMIIPGVSGSFVMMLLGVYETVISSITTLNLYVLVPFALGAVLGIIYGAKLISVLIKKYKLMTYSAIMGLVIGSVYAILPEDFGFTLQTGYGFVCMIFGILAAVLIDKLGGIGASSKDNN